MRGICCFTTALLKVVWIMWLNCWPVHNCLLSLAPLNFVVATTTVFPDLSIYFGEYNVIISDKNDGKNYKNKTQVIINWNNPLIDYTRS